MYREADILVVGTSIDPHIGAVLNLVANDITVCRLNVDEFPATNRVSVTTDLSGAQIVIDAPDGSWNVSRCAVAWFRRLGRPGVSPDLTAAHQRFAGGESEEAIAGMLSIARPRSWLNEYWSTRRASNKILQYETARLVGLPTPETVVSSDPARVREFIGNENPDSFIYKTLHSPVIDYAEQRTRGFVFTNRLERKDLDRLSLVKYAPAQFQRRIEVDFELRVTSIAGEHIAIRIDGASRTSKIRDWRADDARLHYEPYELPSEVASRLSALMNKLGLQFGASDWIVTPSGTYVFLEINPHGAWMWLEERVPDVPITDTVVDFLAHAC